MPAESLQSDAHEHQVDYRQLVYSMVQGVVLQNPNGEIIGANRASERILGLSVEQMKGRTSMDPRWRSIREDGSEFPGREHPAMMALRSGEEVNGVVMGVFHPRWNHYKWIKIDAVPIFTKGADKPHMVFTTFADITEQKLAEQALSRSEKRFRGLYEATTEGIAFHEVIYDSAGEPHDYRIIDINPSFTKHTNIKRETAIGAIASEMYGVNPPPYLDIYSKVAENGDPISFEAYFEPMKKYFRIAVFSPQQGQFTTVFEDITSRKRAEAERDTKVKLQGAMEMAGAACHELNQPLQVMIGTLELMALNTHQTPDLDRNIDSILSELNRLKEITNKIQNITRYETKIYIGDTRIFDLDKASRE